MSPVVWLYNGSSIYENWQFLGQNLALHIKRMGVNRNAFYLGMLYIFFSFKFAQCSDTTPNQMMAVYHEKCHMSVTSVSHKEVHCQQLLYLQWSNIASIAEEGLAVTK